MRSENVPKHVINFQTFGDGSVAQTVLSKGELGSALSIHWSWGIAVMLGIYVAGGVSGAHLNPAVTGALACLGRAPWQKVPVYMLAQYLGAFVAGACVYLVYHGRWRSLTSWQERVSTRFTTVGGGPWLRGRSVCLPGVPR